MDRRPWQEKWARATTPADRPGRFIDQHLLPLFYGHTKSKAQQSKYIEITCEEEFWGWGSSNERIILSGVNARGFKLSDWFPRSPGVYWTDGAMRAKGSVWSGKMHSDPQLGEYYSPESKMHLIEDGGVGTIRLRPKHIDGEYCWMATALSNFHCCSGIPLALPYSLLQESGIIWGDFVNLKGRVRFLNDAGLDDIAASVHRVRPLIVFVEEIEGALPKRAKEPVEITPVSLFESLKQTSFGNDGIPGNGRIGYTFARCPAGSDKELDDAIEWIELYSAKYNGRVITNFDEQRPLLADAPLSYQRLINQSYDRNVVRIHGGVIQVEHIENFSQRVDMTYNTNVGENAIVNIGSKLKDVKQSITASAGLTAAQRGQLDGFVASMKEDLERVRSTHPHEAEAIGEALQKAISNATKPPEERNRNILQLSAKGLKDAAELVADVAPKLLATAHLIAKFIVGL